MARSAALDKYRIDSTTDCSTRETGERALLRSLLARAIYDLTPEASTENRRDAIHWFRKKSDSKLNDELEFTSFQSVKAELGLGARTLEIIEEVVKDSESFEEYRINCHLYRKDVNIIEWLKSRESYRHLNPRRGERPIRVSYRKVTLIQLPND